MPANRSDLDNARLDSAQVAARLGVTIGTVYKLRSEQRGFPKPVGYAGPSPLYAASAIEDYIVARSTRRPSDRGRRPRIVADGVIDASVFPERLRERIRSGAGAPQVSTQAELVARLGLNVVSFGERMRGRTRWKQPELDVIEQLLKMDVTDANDINDQTRAARS